MSASKHSFLYFAPGGYVAALVVARPRKEVFGVFLDTTGQFKQVESICSYKRDAYEPRLFLDDKRNEIFFTCTVERAGANADFQVAPDSYLIVMTKKTATGAHAANTPTPQTKLFVGYTKKQYAQTQGYYNGVIDR